MFKYMTNIEILGSSFEPEKPFEVIGQKNDLRHPSVNGATLRRLDHTDHIFIDRKGLRRFRVIQAIGVFEKLAKAMLPGY